LVNGCCHTRISTACPWLIVDHKDEPNLRGLNSGSSKRYNPPGRAGKPGLYIVRPLPEVDDEAMSETFHKVWQNGSTGLYIDEGALL